MRDGTEESYRRRIFDVLFYIQENLYENTSLEELASIAHFSPYHFHRIFRGMIGEPIAVYIRRLRLEKAAQRLRYSNKTITDLAFDCGYEAVESFIRAFRNQFGMSPLSYRKSNAPAPETNLEELSKHLFQKKGEENMNEIKIKKLEARKVAAVRHVGPYEKCGTAWEKLCSWAGPKGLLGPSTKYLGLCHDDPEVTAPEKIRYDACITLETEQKPEAEITIQEIPAGEYAIFLHKGPLEKLSQSYAYICGQWFPKSGKEMKDAPSIELYLNNPDTTPPEKLEIEIQVPVEK